ncbi:MAG: DUF4363 family protein [Clostridia bacterium]|nr:DUF4363 family protein [Clostridia bacterium]MBR4979111.1 DUF4363 family protein [Clostridia bacterium]
MKSLLTAVLLLAAVIIFVIFNAFFINRFFKETDALLLKLPQTAEEAENLSDSRKKESLLLLERISSEWESKEKYIFSVLEHQKASDFSEALLCAKEYFYGGEYADYAASLASLRNVLSHIVFDEGISFGNVL